MKGEKKVIEGYEKVRAKNSSSGADGEAGPSIHSFTHSVTRLESTVLPCCARRSWVAWGYSELLGAVWWMRIWIQVNEVSLTGFDHPLAWSSPGSTLAKHLSMFDSC